MDELIARLVANVGVEREAAEKAVGIIFEFLRSEGPPDKVQALIDKIPGAAQLLQAQEGLVGAPVDEQLESFNIRVGDTLDHAVLAAAQEPHRRRDEEGSLTPHGTA